jgi:predicted P-loop ATPase
VKVGRIDTEGLQRDRIHIWGEAVHRYRQGEQWWLTRAAETIAAQETKARLIDDPWTSEVLSKVLGKQETCVSQILSDMLIEVSRRDRLMSNRVVSILLQNGWARDGQFTAQPNKGQAKFVKTG